ncbi:rod shape-determining protein MreC [Prosthecobacter sp. SYSU 5D2]|uniref:rod shape-determining protein MreC n=1 Tax=Prosthecobacter sp. SYSU 5D2 TaxID=3134134 RepID=UPI0031FF1D0B
MKKLNILALLLFIAAVVSVFTLDTPVTRDIQSRTMTVLSPFIHSSAAVEQSVTGSSATVEDPRELARENERLQIEVERLRIISQKYAQTLEENNKLRSQLQFQEAAPFKMTAARVIKRVSSTWWNSMIIDKGALDGLATDSPVISAAGLIGKTGKLAPHMAEIILLTDEMCRVSAKIEGSHEQGILAGERAGLDMRPDLRLRFLSKNILLNPGANVVSTGEGGVFPAGLLIGRVKRFENRDLSGEAIVEPAVDFALLEHVFVVEMQPVTEPEATVETAPQAAVPNQ